MPYLYLVLQIEFTNGLEPLGLFEFFLGTTVPIASGRIPLDLF